MKKLLAMLTTITSLSSITPIVLANAPAKNNINYQQINNLENSNRNKRSVEYSDDNDSDEFSYSRLINWTGDHIHRMEPGGFFRPANRHLLLIKPNYWEKIINLYNSSYSKSNFMDSFYIQWFDEGYLKKITVPSWNGSTLLKYEYPQYYFAEKLEQNNGYSIIYVPSHGGVFDSMSEVIWDNWSNINSIWNSGDKIHGIRLNFKCEWSSCEPVDDFCFIKNNGSIYYNKYLKLRNDVSDYGKSEINLGLIDDDSNNSILKKFKEMFPEVDISQFEISEKKEYSFLSKKNSAKINVKNNSVIYPSSFQKKINFISKKFLKEDLPRIIDEENLIENWKSNFSEWKNEINRQKIEDLPKYGDDERGQALKRTWKGNHLIELKNKLLSLNHILETIANKFKINELYENIQGLQNDINDLKQQIIKLNQKIDKLKIDLQSNKDLEICSKYGSFISTTTGWIPFIGTLISTVSGTIAAVCDIAS